MAPPVTGPGATNNVAANQATNTGLKASDMLQDGRFKVNPEKEPAKQFAAFIGGLGDSSSKAVTARTEQKMTDWINAHPGADEAAVNAQLKKTLMHEALVQNEIKNTLQKFMNDLFNKMKEDAADRFS